MITEQRVEKALEFIRDYADELGQLRGSIEEAKHAVKVYEAQAFLAASGTVAERQAKALNDREALGAAHRHADAVTQHAILQTKYKAAELTIEVWRSQSANQRRGHV